MTTKLVNVSSGEALGYPAYFRAVFEPGTLALGDHDFTVGMQRTLASLPALVLAGAINGDTRVAGDTASVVDLRVFPEAKANTVADLVNALEGLTYLTDVRSIQRVASADVYGSGAVAQRTAVQTTVQAQQSHETIASKIGDTASAAVTTARNVLIGVAVLVVLVLYLRSPAPRTTW